jgi:adenine-specific DNA-methyltransferase
MEYSKISKEIYDPIKENKAKFAERFGEQLAELFPSAVKDGDIDFNSLLDELGQYADSEEERYELKWAGKAESKRKANTDLVGKTLKFISSESKNPNTTENLYIEGDNLEVLKLLRKSYFNKVNIIYIDPPYNTGSDKFLYPDDFGQTDLEAGVAEGDIDESGVKLIANQDGTRRYHTNWLNLMYPVLKTSWDLLADDGVILINMDEHEIVNLQKLMNEIYRENNELGTIIWDKRNPKGDAKGISYQHEYIVVFAKNIESYLMNNNVKRPKKNAEKILNRAQQLFSKISPSVTLEDVNKEFSNWINSQQDLSGGEKAYNKIDKNGDVYRPVSMAWPNKKKAPDEYFLPLIHPITNIPCPVPAKGWRNPPATMKKLLEEDKILFGEDETTIPNRKYLLKENMNENIPSLLYYGGSDEELLNNLGIPFDTPKVVNVCMEHITSFAQNDAIVLDFFSGSATTAHAVMQLNANDGGSRKFIMVQVPELCDEKSEAYNLGFKNICEIGKERIRRSGDKIKEDNKNKEGIDRLDTGFKVFKVADTNIRWFSEAIKSDILDYDMKMTDKDKLDFNPSFTDIDVVYEILLRHRDIPLSTNVEQLTNIGNRTYIFADTVVVCLEESISDSMIDKIAAIEPMPTKIIFRDSAFGDDISLKENTMIRLEAQMRKQSGLEKRAYRVEFI